MSRDTPALATALTDDLGLQLPLCQAPMGDGVAGPALSAAVGEAGALGAPGTVGMAPDAIAAAAAEHRRRTAAPLHLNLARPHRLRRGDTAASARAALAPLAGEVGATLPDPDPDIPTDPETAFARRVEAVCSAAPEVISLTGGIPDENHLRALRGTGALLLGTATTVSEGLMLEDTRAIDAVIAQGAAAGGHRATFAVPWRHGLVDTLALVQALRAVLRRPVLAAGGIMTGGGVRAALAAGAVGAVMGTAFLGADEAGTARRDQDALTAARDDGTTVTPVVTGHPGRALRTRFVEELAGAPVAAWPHQDHLTAPIRTAAGRAGDPGLRALWAGQGAALMRRAPAAEILAAVRAEAGA